MNRLKSPVVAAIGSEGLPKVPSLGSNYMMRPRIAVAAAVMIRRLMATVVLAGALVITGGSGAYAAPPERDPNCTFEKGKTTCVERTVVVTEGREPCGAPGQYRYYTFMETTTITKVYKGRNTDREPVSTETTGPVILREYGECDYGF